MVLEEMDGEEADNDGDNVVVVVVVKEIVVLTVDSTSKTPRTICKNITSRQKSIG